MAWQNLFEQTVANVKVSFDPGDGPRDHTIDELLANMYSTRPAAAHAHAGDAVHGALEPLTPMLAHCYDSLVADRLVDDRLRNFDDADGARNLDNELENAGGRRDDGGDRVAPLDRAPLVPPQGGAAGRAEAALADQYAPLGEGRAFSYDEARAIVGHRVRAVLGATSRSSREASSTTGASTPSRARASAAAPSARRSRRTSQPFIMLNYTDRCAT